MVQYDRPNAWEIRNGGPLEVVFNAHLDSVTEGTRLSVEFDARPHGLFRLVLPLLLRRLRRDEKANMIHLREALEPRRDNQPQVPPRWLSDVKPKRRTRSLKRYAAPP